VVLSLALALIEFAEESRSHHGSRSA
jgi:hypothetical protein